MPFFGPGSGIYHPGYATLILTRVPPKSRFNVNADRMLAPNSDLGLLIIMSKNPFQAVEAFNHRLNMELDSQSLFWALVYSCSHC